jgi:hypothetical protein
VVVSISQWISFVFDHSVTDPAWHFSIDAPSLDPGPDRVAELIAETFEQAAELMSPFSNEQLNQGFWFLLSPGNSDYMCCLSDDTVSWTLRRRALRSFVPLFREVMSVRCTPSLGHREKVDGTLNSACFMWWDLLPLSEGCAEEDEDVQLTDEILGVLSDILQIPHDACRESALHGLGHWAVHYPRAAAIIDRFLRESNALRPDLVEYAEQARAGRIM